MATGQHATSFRMSREEQGAAQHTEGDANAICLTWVIWNDSSSSHRTAYVHVLWLGR